MSEVTGVLPSRHLGERRVAAVGLGGAPIALRPVIPDEASAIRMVHAALDAGVTFLDTADVYSPQLGRGYSESVFGRAVRTWAGGRDDVLIATKGGKYWGADGQVRVDALASRRHRVSVERVAIAWELALSPAVIPIPGATRPETILDSVRAADLVLEPGDLELLGGVTARPADQVPPR